MFIDWSISRCSTTASVGVEKNAGETYAKDGRSKKGCTDGVGKEKANAVYRITNLPPPW